MSRGPAGGRRPVDPLHKDTLTFRQHGVGVQLEVLEGTFSSAGVDAGTRHLLRWLSGERYADVASVLDLGCGYGPIGLWLAAAGADVDRAVLAVDRDARALLATERGAVLGELPRVEVHGSLGYDQVGERRFDLVVSNVPAKVGSRALAHLVLDAVHHLTDAGSVALVVVDRLAEEVADMLLDPAIEVLATRPNRAYTVFEYRFDGLPDRADPAPGFERGLYGRGEATFRHDRLEWTAEVVHSIPEFDELGHGTVAALELLDAGGVGSAANVLLDGVGQGHLARALRAKGHAGPIHLHDRDLLALRTAALGLEGAVRSEHAARLAASTLAGADLVVVALPEREPVAVTAAVLGVALAGLDHGAELLLHGRTADVHRVVELLPRNGARLQTGRAARRGSHSALRTKRR